MVRVTRKKKKKVRRVYGLVFLIFLSATAGVGLYKLSPSLLDIGRIFRHAADKILEESADTTSAEPVLRGTVFDRNLQELAVSYKLYSLYARPAEITDTKNVVQIVADITGDDEASLIARLDETNNIINLAENLEQQQVDLIKNARLPGLYVKPVEERYYPEHETAASLIGFTGKGIGLSGVEGAFDILLQEGEFRTESVAEIDFSKERVLGSAKVDVILSIDLDLQKHVEQQLKAYLDRSKASRGIALLMDPKNGAVVAWANQPSFNPNYYWQARYENSKSMFEQNIDPELLHKLRVRVAATIKQGESGDFLLPETIAVPDFGLTAEEIDRYWKQVDRKLNRNRSFPSCDVAAEEESGAQNRYATDNVGVVDWAADASILVNGGWQVSPHVLKAVYDHGKELVHERSGKEAERQRLLTPSMGIKIRREMISLTAERKPNMIMFADKVNRVRKNAGKSEYIMQEAVIAAVPSNAPELLLFLVTQFDNLNPFAQDNSSAAVSISDFGKKLLSKSYQDEQTQKTPKQYLASAIPKSSDRTNYNQFLISSRVDFQERSLSGSSRVAVMPQLLGLSLRKGLQRLNEYHVQVKVKGSGQIVSQIPGPGESLQGIGECVLTLGSEI